MITNGSCSRFTSSTERTGDTSVDNGPCDLNPMVYIGPIPRFFSAKSDADASASLLASNNAACPLYADGTKSRVRVARMPFHRVLSPMKDALLVPGQTKTVSTCP